MTGVDSIVFGTLAHDRIGYSIAFNGDPLPTESLIEIMTLLRRGMPPYPVMLTGRFPDEKQLFTIVELIREAGHRIGWITNGRFIPASKSSDDYWMVQLGADPWLVHRCSELWWNGEGNVPSMPTPVPLLYLTAAPKDSLAIIKKSPLLWNVVVAHSKPVREVLYEHA